MQSDGKNIHPRSRQGSLLPTHVTLSPTATAVDHDHGFGLELTPTVTSHGKLQPRDGSFGLSQAAYLLTAEEVVRELTTDPDNGLSVQEANNRLQQFGLNELDAGGGVSVLRILMGQIFNAMVLVSMILFTIS